MIRPDTTKWGQTLSDLRRLSVTADHPRTRERFLALYMIGSGQSNATRWAAEIGRSDNTVMGWVHLYNADGLEALYYWCTGGRTPFLVKMSLISSLRP
jgi:transposase